MLQDGPGSRWRWPVFAAVLAGLSLLAYLVVILAIVHPTLVDLRVYRSEGNALLDGIDLYGPLADVHGVNTYPPFAALVFVPAALAPLGVVEVASVVGNVVLLGVVSWLSVRLARGSAAGGATVAVVATCVLAAFAIWSEPVTTTFLYGQVNLALLALVLWDATRPPDSRLRGIGIGLAAGIKVTPGIFIVYLLLTGRVRAAVTAGLTFLGTVGLTALFAADATWTYWTHKLFDFSRIGRLENSVNQSVRGWLVRMHHSRDTPSAEMLLVLAVLITGLAVAVFAYRRLGEAWGLPAAAVTGLLVSPISWSHHWVWCVPILALLWFQARVWVIPTLLAFWSYVVWLVPHGNAVELDLTRFEIAWSGVYTVFGLGFLALAAVRARAATPTRADA